MTQGQFLKNACTIEVKNVIKNKKKKKKNTTCRCQKFSTNNNFDNTFCKGSPKEHLCEIISKFDEPLQRRIAIFLYHPYSTDSNHHQSHISRQTTISQKRL